MKDLPKLPAKSSQDLNQEIPLDQGSQPNKRRKLSLDKQHKQEIKQK